MRTLQQCIATYGIFCLLYLFEMSILFDLGTLVNISTYQLIYWARANLLVRPFKEISVKSVEKV